MAQGILFKEDKPLRQAIGDLTELDTTEKSNLVGAINEVKGDTLTTEQMDDIKEAFSVNQPITYAANPVGCIIQMMAVTAPAGYLACDGTAYNIANYSSLAAFIKAQFGTANYFGGDGTTTFAVPDLRGEFLRGTGTNSHSNQGNGAAVGVHQDGTLIPETFSNASNINSSTLDGETHYKNSDGYIKNSDGAKARAIIKASSFDEWGYGDTVRPTNTSVLFCIKAVVAGEVYSTEERVVGTWIDGKKLYQKTVNCGALPNATAKDINIATTNAISVKNIYGYALRNSDGMVIALPRSNPTLVNNISVDIILNQTQIRIVTGGDYSPFTETYITLQYTKTTD